MSGRKHIDRMGNGILAAACVAGILIVGFAIALAGIYVYQNGYLRIAALSIAGLYLIGYVIERFSK